MLEAAERLLRRDGADFSMRELAAEAGVSFATPFNLFGGKTAIAQAISARMIALMETRLEGAPSSTDAPSHVLAAVSIAVDVLLEDDRVSRAVIGSLGMPTATPAAVAADSRDLWTAALEGWTGIDPGLSDVARSHLAYNLALVFRGCLSFWAAGEIKDADLKRTALSGAAAVLLGVATPAKRQQLAMIVRAAAEANQEGVRGDGPEDGDNS